MTQPAADRTNLVLIGMPGVGKSTVGVLLAKATGRDFLDTDVYIQAREGQILQSILDADGHEAFCRMEERHIVALTCRNHVIATGGSVVYSNEAMRHLKAGGTLIWLTLPLESLERRITDMAVRGIVMAHSHTLAELYSEREPLYRRWADVTVDYDGLSPDQVVASMLAALLQKGLL
jgi:shikimate kinase